MPPQAIARIGNDLVTKRQARALMPRTFRRDELREPAKRLILLEWLRREARGDGLAGEARKATAAPGEAEARTPAVATQVELVWLLQRLLQRASGPPPSEAQQLRLYREHPKRFAHPEVRFMRLVATDSRARALAAKRALERGRGWKAVIDRYATRRRAPTPASGNMGAGPGEMPAGLDEALYAAHLHAFNGPVKTDQAWYVFQLTAVDALPRRSFAEARSQVVTQLQTRRSERGRRLLERRLLLRYRPMTLCAGGLDLPYCRNTPISSGAETMVLAP